MEGQIDDEDLKYYGKVVVLVMINFQIKCVMVDLWCEFQKDVLEEFFVFYFSVYSGECLKNWLIIFMFVFIFFVVWEEIQFDCYYCVLDLVVVEKFCIDMEIVLVGVIVGFFYVIFQKFLLFIEWDIWRYGQFLNNNFVVCDVMIEVRQYVIKYGENIFIFYICDIED